MQKINVTIRPKDGEYVIACSAHFSGDLWWSVPAIYNAESDRFTVILGEYCGEPLEDVTHWYRLTRSKAQDE